jgi:hypothetical protein
LRFKKKIANIFFGGKTVKIVRNSDHINDRW